MSSRTCRRLDDSNQTRDAAIISRIAGGDLEAIGVLYDAYASMLCAVAQRLVGSVEMSDVLHDAFVTVSERAASYSVDRGTVAAWLVWLTRNTALDRLRRRACRAKLLPKIAFAATAITADDDDAAREVDRTRARVLLAALREVDRETLELAFFGGLSYSEIAACQGVPLGTVKSRAARALDALRDALSKQAARPSAPAQVNDATIRDVAERCRHADGPGDDPCRQVSNRGRSGLGRRGDRLQG
jgi:RNA polymerase sigma-70 factor (ECF subfamily)